MKLAFITDEKNPQLTDDDKILQRYFQHQNIEVEPVIWGKEGYQWHTYDSIILRSPWDYFLREPEFIDWLSTLDQEKSKVFNAVSTVKWNMDKKYLIDLEQKGVSIPPTILIPKGSVCSLEEIMNKQNWDKVVIKPTLSAGAYQTFVADRNTIYDNNEKLNALVLERSVLIQKFAEEIIDEGELSLMYFNKKYSHAVVKRAKHGDFRIQTEYGGSYHAYYPSDSLLEQVDQILFKIPDQLLYTRIDGYLDAKENFQLMEVELIEPVLFFDNNPHAANFFFKAFQDIFKAF